MSTFLAGLSIVCVLAAQGIPWEGPDVTYGPDDLSRQTAYTGSRIEYLEATPSPGAAVAAGAQVEFTVRVRYALQQADSGRIFVWFTGKNGEILDTEAMAVRVRRAATAEQSFTIATTIPAISTDLVLHAGIAAAEQQKTVRDLRIRYAVQRRR